MTREEFDAQMLAKLPSGTGAVSALALREALGICFDEAAKNVQPVSSNALSYAIGQAPAKRSSAGHHLFLSRHFT